MIKYPNWYDHFQGLGFNLEAQPAMFDGIYTGTETRDPSSSQHLQAYLGYNIFRYFENLKPGGNGGGWVDTGDALSGPVCGTTVAYPLCKSAGNHPFDIRQLHIRSVKTSGLPGRAAEPASTMLI